MEVNDFSLEFSFNWQSIRMLYKRLARHSGHVCVSLEGDVQPELVLVLQHEASSLPPESLKLSGIFMVLEKPQVCLVCDFSGTSAKALYNSETV